MGVSLSRAIRRRLQRDAIRDLAVAGWTNDEIATLLGIAPRSVERERASLREVERRLMSMKANREALAARLA